MRAVLPPCRPACWLVLDAPRVLSRMPLTLKCDGVLGVTMGTPSLSARAHRLDSGERVRQWYCSYAVRESLLQTLCKSVADCHVGVSRSGTMATAMKHSNACATPSPSRLGVMPALLGFCASARRGSRCRNPEVVACGATTAPTMLATLFFRSRVFSYRTWAARAPNCRKRPGFYPVPWHLGG